MYNVIYVDDEADLLEITKVFLESTGEFSVQPFISAQDALLFPDLAKSDAIVSDYQMPEMDGIAFLKVVRQRFGDIPFILFTGRGREEVVIDAINHGADFYLQKGGNPTAQFAELSHKIRHAIGRKQAEQELHDSQRRLSDIIEFLPDATFAIDSPGKVIAWNRAIEKLTGITANEILGRDHYEYSKHLYGERRKILIDMLDESDEEISRYYSQVSHEGNAIIAESENPVLLGKKAILQLKACPLFNEQGERAGAVESIRDITAIKITETELKRSEEKFRTIVETSPNMIWELDLEGKFIYISPIAQDILGYSPGEMIGRRITDFVPPEAKTAAIKELSEIISNQAKISPVEFPALHRNGSIVYIEIHPALLSDSEGTITGLEGVAVDITERKRYEDDLKISRNQLGNALDIANLVNWEYDPFTGIFTFDDRFYALYGTSVQHEGGTRMSADDYIRNFVHPEDRERASAFIRMCPLGREKIPDPLIIEHRIVQRNGKTKYIVVRVGVTRSADGNIIRVHGANQDITERKMAEEALSRANRQLNLLTSVTRHDILNKISVVRGYLNLARKRCSDPQSDDFLKKADAATDSIQTHIEFTRVYQDLGTQEAQWMNLEEIASHLPVPENIRFITDLQGMSVFSDPILEKVFSNLLDNSIRHGEHVTEIRFRGDKDGEDLIVVWQDNGIGIEADVKEQIFERGYGKNTGLGMFLAREILSLTGITIRENGIPGSCARFEMRIPAGKFRVEKESSGHGSGTP